MGSRPSQAFYKSELGEQALRLCCHLEEAPPLPKHPLEPSLPQTSHKYVRLCAWSCMGVEAGNQGEGGGGVLGQADLQPQGRTSPSRRPQRRRRPCGTATRLADRRRHSSGHPCTSRSTAAWCRPPRWRRTRHMHVGSRPSAQNGWVESTATVCSSVFFASCSPPLPRLGPVAGCVDRAGGEPACLPACLTTNFIFDPASLDKGRFRTGHRCGGAGGCVARARPLCRSAPLHGLATARSLHPPGLGARLMHAHVQH